MSDQTNLDPNVFGAGVLYHIHPPPTARPAEQVVEVIRDKVEAGETDPEDLQRRLSKRFGAKAEGIVTEDGVVDYGRLERVVAEYRAAVEDRVRHRLGEGAHAVQDEKERVKAEQGQDSDVPEVPHVPEAVSVIPEPPKTPEPHGIRQFVDKILDELVGDDLDSGSVVNLKT